MYIKEAHILIDQKLQNIGAFVHSDIDPQEVDLQLKTEMWKILDIDFPDPKGTQINKPKLDKYSILLVKEMEFAVTDNGLGYFIFNTPANYFHFVKLDTIVLYECSKVNVASGKLEQDSYYKVLDKAITYNSVNRPVGTIFKAGSNSNYTATVPNSKTKVLKLKVRKSPTRVIEEEFTSEVNNNSLTKSKIYSPIVNLAEEKIFINVNDFYIEKVYLSYLKKPVTPNIGFKTYSQTDALAVQTAYEVIEGTIQYNGTTYTVTKQLEPIPFTTTGLTTFTGTGKVRLKNDGDIMLPYQTALKVVDAVVNVLSVESEQPQTKVQNLVAMSAKNEKL